MKALCSILFLCLPLFLFSQFSSPKTIFRGIGEKSDIHIADLDGNGHPDIAATAEWGMIWYRHIDGNGNFEKRQIIDNSSFNSLHLEDLDSDGDMDVIAALDNVQGGIADSQRVVWYANDGHGFFSGRQTIATTRNFAGYGPDVKVLDVDNDNDPDVLFTGTDYTIRWLENDGTGFFFEQHIIAEDADKIDELFLHDLNGDGLQDIIYMTFNDTDIAWYANLGNGDFSERRLINEDTHHATMIADSDNDGDIDITIFGLIGNPNISYLFIKNLFNDGQGNFTSQVYYEETEIEGEEFHPNHQAIDIEGDGDLDILLIAEGDLIRQLKNQVICLKNDGQGNFANPEVILDSGGTGWLGTFDINSDSHLDMLTLSILDSELSWYPGNTSTDFGDRNIISTETRGFTSVHTADLNQDGTKDVLAASWIDNSITWFPNNGNGIFGEQQNVTTELNEVDVAFAVDYDNDGDQDIVAATDDASWSDNLNKIVLFENDGAGAFSEDTVLIVNSQVQLRIEIGDIDNDGKPDILLSQNAEDEIRCYLNDGQGNFNEEVTLVTQIPGIVDLHLEDLDDDGDLDLITAQKSSSPYVRRISWLANEGSGNFSSLIEVADLNDLTSINAADFDGDGDMDILAGSSDTFGEEDRVNWYANDGNGNFSEANLIYFDGVKSVFPADLDGDGDIDVAAAVYPGSAFSWYINDGQGNFPYRIVLSQDIVYPTMAYATDLDDDGDQDMLATSYLDNQLLWFENLSDYQTIRGNIFWDENENGLFDSTEVGLNNIPVSLQPHAPYYFSNPEGSFHYWVEKSTYQLSASIPEHWALTTDSSTYTVTLDTVSQTRNFGFKPTTDLSDVQTYLTSAPTRCNTVVNYWLDYSNKGTRKEKGRIKLVLDPRVEIAEVLPEADFADGDTLIWEYSDLQPSYAEKIHLKMLIPGPEALGDSVKMAVYVFTETENGDLNLSDQYAYASEIRCSFDPNDKLTLPNRNGDENYTLFGEELEYTIRFQNTGNDVAFDVVIKDQLDQNLDWSTFRPISGSHEFATHFYEETGVIEFIFENIFLPPSNMDEAGSQGYVKFTIKAKTDLAENTLVENDAAIYFDLNPPIYTNTVQNTMVYELPVINQTANEKPGLEINIFPNPFDQTFTIRIEGDGSRHDYHFRLRDSMGRLIQTGQWKNQSVHQVQTHNLSAGLYFIEIMEKSGQGIFSGKLVKK